MILTIDFETYYDRAYSLARLTTEEYIRDPRFEVLGVSIKRGTEPAEFYPQPVVKQALDAIDFSRCSVLAHNAMFDAAILSWRYGKTPRLLLDTLSMARPKHGQIMSLSLESLAKHYNLGEKGAYLRFTEGKRYADLSPVEVLELASYANQDVELTRKLFNVLSAGFPRKEIEAIDLTLRLFTEPQLELDTALLNQHLIEIINRKEKALARLGPDGLATLMSNDKFAKALQDLGVDPPTKISKVTGKTAWAFAKTDQGLKDLLLHSNPEVVVLTEARLGVKSTIEETRTNSLLEIAGRGTLPVQLNYWGAHTGRYSGAGKINLQNLPRGGNLRKAIVAPDGYTLVTCDLAQIEARMLATIAKQEDLVDAFANKRDIYSEFASQIYGRTITKEDKRERFVGKTCLAEGTMVLVRTNDGVGWKPIESVRPKDKLWDGIEWVSHRGLIDNGIRDTITLAGVSMTPDHEVLVRHAWLTAETLAQDSDLLSLALGTASETLQSLDSKPAKTGVSRRFVLSVAAALPSIPLLTTASRAGVLSGVGYAQYATQRLNATPYIHPQWGPVATEPGYLTDLALQYPGAINPAMQNTYTTAEEALEYATSGRTTEPAFSDIYKRYPDGMRQNWTWTESTQTGTTPPETYGSSAEQRTTGTADQSALLKKRLHVYDIGSAGPRHRFTIRTERGPLIVHNCILGLGYGMGAEKLVATLAIGQGGISVGITLSEAKHMVNTYRNKYSQIREFWRACDHALKSLPGYTNLGSGITMQNDGIYLPNNTKVLYPDLRSGADGYEYSTRKGPTKIYGGKVTENLIQALARIVIVEQMLDISKRYRVVLQVHDEIVSLVPSGEETQAVEFIQHVMSTPPTWLPELPIACEVGVGKNYGECK